MYQVKKKSVQAEDKVLCSMFGVQSEGGRSREAGSGWRIN